MSMQLTDVKDQLAKRLSSLGMVVNNHRTVVIILIASAAIIATLMQTGQYIDPPRNEDAYLEQRAQINYKSIDQEIVQKLEKTQSDQDVNVNSNFVPDRSNPFAE